jgi:hypothetical protein
VDGGNQNRDLRTELCPGEKGRGRRPPPGAGGRTSVRKPNPRWLQKTPLHPSQKHTASSRGKASAQVPPPGDTPTPRCRRDPVKTENWMNPNSRKVAAHTHARHRGRRRGRTPWPRATENGGHQSLQSNRRDTATPGVGVQVVQPPSESHSGLPAGPGLWREAGDRGWRQGDRCGGSGLTEAVGMTL